MILLVLLRTAADADTDLISKEHDDYLEVIEMFGIRGEDILVWQALILKHVLYNERKPQQNNTAAAEAAAAAKNVMLLSIIDQKPNSFRQCSMNLIRGEIMPYEVYHTDENN